MHWKALHTIGLIILLILLLSINPTNPGQQWILNLVVLLIFALVIGHGVTGSWKGTLVDERNKMSLSRFQLLSWTIILLSAFITVAILRIKNGCSIQITMDEQLWALMGISTASLVGSPLIKSTKTNKKADTTERNRTVKALNGTINAKSGSIQASSNVNVKGQIIINKRVDMASVSDLFKGEETGNATTVDLAKVQMFFFTMIIMIVYVSLLYRELTFMPNETKVIDGIQAEKGVFFILAKQGFNFPVIENSMLTLLGISHAGYLINKAVPHSKD